MAGARWAGWIEEKVAALASPQSIRKRGKNEPLGSTSTNKPGAANPLSVYTATCSYTASRRPAKVAYRYCSRVAVNSRMSISLAS